MIFILSICINYGSSSISFDSNGIKSSSFCFGVRELNDMLNTGVFLEIMPRGRTIKDTNNDLIHSKNVNGVQLVNFPIL